MTDSDYKNIYEIQRILKFIDNGKFDINLWSNVLELNNSLKKLLSEHKKYLDHMKNHH